MKLEGLKLVVRSHNVRSEEVRSMKLEVFKLEIRSQK